MKDLSAIVASNPIELDVTRRLSLGIKDASINALDERAKAQELKWNVTNTDTVPHWLVISPLFVDEPNKTIFANVRDMLNNVLQGVEETQAHAFENGDVYVKSGDTAKKVTVSSLKSGRDVNQFLRYIGNNPTRLTRMRLTSTLNSGAAEMGNFTNDLKTMFFSPFDNPVEKTLGLSNLVNQAFLTNKILDVDFIDQAFPVVLSSSHFFAFQINAGTTLTISAFVGSADDKDQRFWRDMKNRDQILRTHGLGK